MARNQRPRFNLNTPPGRIVAGAVYRPSTPKGSIDKFGKLQEADNWFFGLAVPKTDPRLGDIFNAMYGFALQTNQHLPDVMQRIQMGILRPNTNFAWKLDDGDAPDLRGRPGYAGCIIFKFNTQLPIRCVDAMNQPIDPNRVRTGYYADVAFSISPNGKPDKTAGLFMSPDFVRVLGTAEEIQPGPSAEQRFAGQAAVQMGAALPGPGGAPGGYQGYQPQPQQASYQGGYQAQPAANPPQQGYQGGYPAQPAANPPQQGYQGGYQAQPAANPPQQGYQGGYQAQPAANPPQQGYQGGYQAQPGGAYGVNPQGGYAPPASGFAGPDASGNPAAYTPTTPGQGVAGPSAAPSYNATSAPYGSGHNPGPTLPPAGGPVVQGGATGGYVPSGEVQSYQGTVYPSEPAPVQGFAYGAVR